MQFHDVNVLDLQWKTMCHTKSDNFKKQTNKNWHGWIYKLWSFNLMKGLIHAYSLYSIGGGEREREKKSGNWSIL